MGFSFKLCRYIHTVILQFIEDIMEQTMCLNILETNLKDNDPKHKSDSGYC